MRKKKFDVWFTTKKLYEEYGYEVMHIKYRMVLTREDAKNDHNVYRGMFELSME